MDKRIDDADSDRGVDRRNFRSFSNRRPHSKTSHIYYQNNH